jgi:hypothetical protein
MCKRVSSWLCRISTGWAALAALVVFALFVAFVLPNQSAQESPEAAEAGSPDLSLWYTPADLYRMAEAYGPAGRQAYIRARFTFDVAWPIVYGAFLVTAISWLYARAFRPDDIWSAASFWPTANLAPVMGVLLDVLENLSTSLVMARYPARTPGIDALAPVFTLVKWIFVGGSFVLLLVGLVAAIWRWIARTRRQRRV